MDQGRANFNVRQWVVLAASALGGVCLSSDPSQAALILNFNNAYDQDNNPITEISEATGAVNLADDPTAETTFFFENIILDDGVNEATVTGFATAKQGNVLLSTQTGGTLPGVFISLSGFKIQAAAGNTGNLNLADFLTVSETFEGFPFGPYAVGQSYMDGNVLNSNATDKLQIDFAAQSPAGGNLGNILTYIAPTSAPKLPIATGKTAAGDFPLPINFNSPTLTMVADINLAPGGTFDLPNTVCFAIASFDTITTDGTNETKFTQNDARNSCKKSTPEASPLAGLAAIITLAGVGIVKRHS
ncbi:hypothetical protein BST81_15865 [Leptolyngbya sp. 'hensonii']|uniref:hypothetical protein n=1 Tax=Leptolyngbya sp. 'hensonii' TaxID=1922337 RepID=UPI00094FA8F5|nr:hypothetical protein [Leptolyngbya sp. 'hensonii']OLP17292.1 hypothetical protein BST81_15865 [Leptolyngbya sp. 'hensonii']